MCACVCEIIAHVCLRTCVFEIRPLRRQLHFQKEKSTPFQVHTFPKGKVHTKMNWVALNLVLIFATPPKILLVCCGGTQRCGLNRDSKLQFRCRCCNRLHTNLPGELLKSICLSLTDQPPTCKIVAAKS